jgi:hypothetical protein
VANKRLIHAGKRIDVTHHTGGAVNNGEMVPEQFLGPAANLVDLAVVFEDLFHCAAVA